MRVTRKTLDEHGAAILRSAGTLFRGRGIDNVGVADVTREAGLTHGAFYGHFPSKAALAAASCADGLARSAASWRARAANARAVGRDGLSAIIHAYLTTAHRDAPENGCALAANGIELARGDASMRAALATGIAGLADIIAEELAIRRPGIADSDRDRAALAVLSCLTGGLLLARGLASPEQSQQALDAAIAAAHAAADT